MDMVAIEVFGLSGGPLAAVAFVTLCVLLLVYAGVDRARRHREFEDLMPSLGFQPVEDPDPAGLVSDELFYPNGFESQGLEGGYGSILPRIAVAWSGTLGGREVMMLEVSITRPHAVKTSKSINRTVIRYVPSGAVAPPDFMIHEWVLFKGQIRGARAVSGPAQMGQHYYLFSDAPDEELAPWITTALRERLAEHRLWRIAAHDGVFFLSRSTSWQQPGEIPGFLAEAEAILSGLMASVDPV